MPAPISSTRPFACASRSCRRSARPASSVAGQHPVVHGGEYASPEAHGGQYYRVEVSRRTGIRPPWKLSSSSTGSLEQLRERGRLPACDLWERGTQTVFGEGAAQRRGDAGRRAARRPGGPRRAAVRRPRRARARRGARARPGSTAKASTSPTSSSTSSGGRAASGASTRSRTPRRSRLPALARGRARGCASRGCWSASARPPRRRCSAARSGSAGSAGEFVESPLAPTRAGDRPPLLDPPHGRRGARAAMERLRRRPREVAREARAVRVVAAQHVAQRGSSSGCRKRSRFASKRAGITRSAGQQHLLHELAPSASRSGSSRRRAARRVGGARGRASWRTRRFVTGFGATRLTGPDEPLASRAHARSPPTSSSIEIQLMYWRPPPSGPPSPSRNGRELRPRAHRRRGSGPSRSATFTTRSPGLCRRLASQPPTRPRRRPGSPSPREARLGQLLVPAVAVDSRPQTRRRRPPDAGRRPRAPRSEAACWRCGCRGSAVSCSRVHLPATVSPARWTTASTPLSADSSRTPLSGSQK